MIRAPLAERTRIQAWEGLLTAEAHSTPPRFRSLAELPACAVARSVRLPLFAANMANHHGQTDLLPSVRDSHGLGSGGSRGVVDSWHF